MQRHRKVREINTPDKKADRRHNDVVHKRRNNFSKRSANNDCEREIKNVVTVLAKTCHYWSGHIPPEQRERIATLFVDLALDTPLLVPSTEEDGGAGDDVAEAIARHTALTRSPLRYRGWLGLDCGLVPRAVWLMRALVTDNVLARREGTVLFVPINPRQDPDGRTVIAAVTAAVAGLARDRDAPAQA